MNYPRLSLAALAAFVAYFILGGIVFAVTPLASEFQKYPAVFRPQREQLSMMPVGMAAMFLSVVAVGAIFAQTHREGSNLLQGASFGALIGLFAACAFGMHNYVNLNVGMALSIGESIGAILEWTVVGIVLALVYRPKQAA